MPNLGPISNQLLAYGPFILVVGATFLALEALFLAVLRTRRKDRMVNNRLRVLAHSDNREEALVELRRQRSLTPDGRYRSVFLTFNRLLMQSGTKTPYSRVLLRMAIAGLAAMLIVYFLSFSLWLGALLGIVAGVLVPLTLLMVMRARRLNKIEEQLPEAVDVMVRSLRAGHPVTVSLSLVARELPDPIGSEFGMVSDEMTYGLDLGAALNNLRVRTGQSDLALLVVAISIQVKSGGNLAELLTTLSQMVRLRARVRRKIHSLSSEGRYSAILLSIIPLAIFGIISFVAPSYYRDVSHDPLFTPAIYLGASLWVIGVYIMRRMVNFKI